jgi:hypothetical protein
MRFFRFVNEPMRDISLLKLISIFNIKNGRGASGRSGRLTRNGSLGVLGMAPGKGIVVLFRANAAAVPFKERRLF